MEQQREKKRVLSKQAVAILLLLLLGSIGTVALLYSPLFAVGQVLIRGNQYISSAEVYTITGLPDRVNIFSLTTSEVQQKLGHDLRIEQATVRRIFPNTLEIQITERVPLAVIACDYGYLDLGRQGVVLDAYRNLKPMRVPMITGESAANLYVGDVVESEPVQRALEFLASLDEQSLQQLSELHLLLPDHMIAYTTGGVQIRLGSFDRLEEKAKSTQEFLTELKMAKYPNEYIDFNYSSPFIKFKK